MSRVLIAILCFTLANQSWADHPNEGPLTLQEITERALANNRDVKIAEQAYSASTFDKSRAWGAFLPELSLEGGPLSAKFDEESNSGTAAYAIAEWNLYRGGQDAAEYDKAKIEQELLKRRLDFAKSKIRRDAARLYYEMLYVLESVSLKEKALEMNREQMKMAQVKKNAGLTSEADVLEFELRESTIASDLKLLNQQRQAISRELSLLLGVDEPSEKFTAKGHLESETLKIEKEKILSDFAGNNEEIIEARSQYEIGLQDKTIARGAFLPSLDLEASYGKLADEEKVYEEPDNYSVFLRLKIPLFSGFRNYNSYKSSQIQVAQKEVALQGSLAKVKSELGTLFTELDSIRERIALEEKNIARSEKYYKITLAEYRRGVKNSPDVVGATEGLFEARTRNLEFRRDFHLTKLKILAINGVGNL